MQIIRPDMLPVFAAFAIALLVIIGLICFALIIDSFREKAFFRSWKMYLGILGSLFIAYNWFGYYSSYAEKSRAIVGVYYGDQPNSYLVMHSNYTWTYSGTQLPCKNGEWSCDVSEDGCFWTMISEQQSVCIPKLIGPKKLVINQNTVFLKRQ